MTAGLGIVHSERSDNEVRKQGRQNVYGIQIRVALPKQREATTLTSPITRRIAAERPSLSFRAPRM
jgi:redox-sensitive bicupin YhaK (pirin superfamily)